MSAVAKPLCSSPRWGTSTGKSRSSSGGRNAKIESDSTTWSEPSTTSPSKPGRSPATPWSGPGIISIAGASGDDAVSQELVKVTLSERIMDEWAANQLVGWAAGTKAKKQTKEDLLRELIAVAADLAGPSPSPAEQMLAEVAALNWFALRLHEARFASASNSEKGLTIAQSEHGQRRIDRAHRRLMVTLKTLATVRKLGVPAVQINLAHQQVNVTGSTSPD
jgi:hypothetical protein